MRSCLFPLLAGAVLCTLPGCYFSMARFTGTQQLTVPHQEGAPIRVQAVNGAITLRKSQATKVEIEARIRATTKERLEQVKIEAERDGTGMLTVQPGWPAPGRQRGEGCSFSIFLPGAKGVEMESSNGALTLYDLAGRASLHTSNGAIKVVGHRGPLTARTSNGRIVIDGVEGELQARTSNGAIRVGATGGPVDLKTSNGSVKFTVAPSYTGDLKATTSNGSIRTEGERECNLISKDKRSIHLSFGKGKAQSRIRTSNGSVTLYLR